MTPDKGNMNDEEPEISPLSRERVEDIWPEKVKIKENILVLKQLKGYHPEYSADVFLIFLEYPSDTNSSETESG